jgi:hypothetical protein
MICGNPFDIVQRKPYLLPCRHQACKMCLQDLVDQKKQLECPQDGGLIRSFKPEDRVRRHDDLLIALTVLEQQMS